MNLLLGITSTLNHGTSNPHLRNIDRIYVPIYLIYMSYYIYNSCYENIIKLLIHAKVMGGVFSVIYCVYLRRSYINEYYITPLHLFSHFVLIFIFNLIVWLDVTFKNKCVF
jgi:hypothetical protein